MPFPAADQTRFRLFLTILLISLTTAFATAQTALKFRSDSASGSVEGGKILYFTTVVPTDPAGLKVALSSANDSRLDLLIGINRQPTAAENDFSSVNVANDELFLFQSDLVPGDTLTIGVLNVRAEGSFTPFTLTTAETIVQDLPWDDGETLAPTNFFSTTSPVTGDALFRVVTEAPDFGAWRIGLTLADGSANADFQILQDQLPTDRVPGEIADANGDDELVLPLSSQSGANQTYFIRVSSQTPASWTLFAGDVFVRDLGVLETDSDVTAGTPELTTGPSGVSFFRVTFPDELAAWRLWTRNEDNETVEADILTNQNEVPLQGVRTQFEEAIEGGAGLLGPDEFSFRAGRFYLLAVYTDPGESFILETREQVITELAFNSTTDEITSDGFPIQTYQVEVPIDQLAWEVTTRATTGDPDIFVRRSFVPTFENNRPAIPGDATFRSQVLGDSSDSITLVPNLLSDGTYFISIVPKDLNSDVPLVYTLFNGEPDITDIDFTDTRVNDDPDRAGWRFYRVVDIDQQLGQLGWLISLDDYVGQDDDETPTEIYIRRNAVPGNATGLFDERSSAGFLQDPEHEADVWYIGVYNQDSALGEFTISSSPINPPTVDFNEGVVIREDNTAVPPGQWSFVRVDVPESINDTAVLGWEIRLSEWFGSRPDLVVRRSILPEDARTIGVSRNDTDFTAGAQVVGSDDWTGRRGQPNEETDGGADQIISLALGNPLVPGTYYIGVRNTSSTEELSYTLTSRGIGDGLAYSPTPITPGQNALSEVLEPRDIQYFSLEVEEDTPLLELELDALTVGSEGALFIRQGVLPTSLQNGRSTTVPFTYTDVLPSQTELDEDGDERLLLLPTSSAPEDQRGVLPAGTYYLLLASQGTDPANNSSVGEGATSFELKTRITPRVIDLGLVGRGETIEREPEVEAGETAFYTFALPENSSALTLTFNSETRGAILSLRKFDDGLFPRGSGYGLIGGEDTLETLSTLQSDTASAPEPGQYVLSFRTSTAGESATGRFTVTNEDAGTIEANDGEVSGTIEPGRWAYYRLTIPESLNNTPILGWEGRLTEWSYAEGAQTRPTVELQRGSFPDGMGRQVGRTARTFPENEKARFGVDWTGYQSEADGSSAGADLFASLPLGNPLEAGDYVLGVKNPSNSEALTFTVTSRLIGPGVQFGLPVTPLSSDSSVEISQLPARAVSYYSLELTEDTSSLFFELENVLPLGSDSRLLIRKDFLPTSLARGNATSRPFGANGQLSPQTELTEDGDDRLLILKRTTEQRVPAGTYYLLVVSEGSNPTRQNVGTGTDRKSVV